MNKDTVLAFLLLLWTDNSVQTLLSAMSEQNCYVMCGVFNNVNIINVAIIKEIGQNQLTRYGHVQRMAEGRLPKIALKWIPKQK